MASIAPAQGGEPGVEVRRAGQPSGYQADLNRSSGAGVGCCAIALTIFSYILVILFFPLSLLFTIKVLPEVFPCCATLCVSLGA